jgi:hypothetical protein
MNSIITTFMSALQKDYLKKRGYTKKRFVYSREMDGYTERVRLKGSPWNHPERPWTFSIDFGFEIAGHPSIATDFPNTHTHAAIEEIVRDATGDYALQHNPSITLASQVMDRINPARQEVRVSDVNELLGEIASHIDEASKTVYAVREDVVRLCLSDSFHDRYFAIVRAIEKSRAIDSNS